MLPLFSPALSRSRPRSRSTHPRSRPSPQAKLSSSSTPTHVETRAGHVGITVLLEALHGYARRHADSTFRGAFSIHLSRCSPEPRAIPCSFTLPLAIDRCQSHMHTLCTRDGRATVVPYASPSGPAALRRGVSRARSWLPSQRHAQLQTRAQVSLHAPIITLPRTDGSLPPMPLWPLAPAADRRRSLSRAAVPRSSDMMEPRSHVRG